MQKTPHLSNTSNNKLEEEFNLSDVLIFMRVNYLTLTISILIGASIGLISTLLIPKQWEARALMQIGQLGESKKLIELQIQDIDRKKSLETPLIVVDRMKSQSFKNDVLKNLSLTESEDNEKVLIFKNSLKVKLEKSDLINLTVRGFGANEAKNSMNAIVKQISSIHNSMLTPTILRTKQELAKLEQDISYINKDYARLTNSLNDQSNQTNEKNLSSVILLNNILAIKGLELRDLNERKRNLEDQLSPEHTFATHVLGRVEVSEKPVFPKKSIFILAGALIGFLLSLLFVKLKLLKVKSH